MEFMPPAKSSRWLFWIPGYALLLWLLFILHRFVLLGQTANGTFLLRFALLSLVISAILNCSGWLGARLLWLITTGGIIIGLGLMFIYSYRDMSGWEDLAGFLTFAIFMLGGFALGLLAEFVQWLMKRLRKS
ncbi:hypothetical protein [Paenibacillus monticola]|uniref:Uncharacterized protein n=1 Tax=Paenibacillus monticola TaxID=2666075 RepID=A0A7X2H1L1_9BACL|nr:hypothetical protein [Paenibacillus monticola]MRN51899.1 hypothetical protein [Paenibacillus monticola]